MTNFLTKNKKELFLLVLFLWAEWERVINENLFGRSGENLIFCVMVIAWAIFLKRRITDDRNRKLLICIAGSLVLLIVLRTFKYSILEKNSILWYMYYLPLTGIPYLTFLMAKGLYGKQNEKKQTMEKWLLVGLVIINGMVISNNIHQMVFYFPDPKDIDTYNYRIGYYLTVVWIVVFVAATFYHLYRACSLPQSRSKMWVPMIPTLVGTALLVISAVGAVPRINDTRIYLFHEITLVMVIAIVEACIRIGVIPSNDGYEEIFDKSNINACITDSTNHVVYSSDPKGVITAEKRLEAGSGKVMLDDHTRLHSNEISGGMLYYTEDIGEIVKLNHMMEEATEIINDENAMIEAENKLLHDEAMYRTKNKLYDDIARLVRPQVTSIEECQELCEKDPDNEMAYISKAALLNAYIKRRVNLSLLQMESDKLPVSELYLAMAETLTYLGYSDVAVNIVSKANERMVDVSQGIELYDYFENVLEHFYGKMTAVMVTIDEKNEETMFRIMLETQEKKEALPEISFAHEICEEDEAITVTVMLG